MVCMYAPSKPSLLNGTRKSKTPKHAARVLITLASACMRAAMRMHHCPVTLAHQLAYVVMYNRKA